MNKKIFILILTVFSLTVSAAAAFADGYTYYPTQQQTQTQSMPIPQYYPNSGQQNQYYYPGTPSYGYGQQPAQPYTYDPNTGYSSPYVQGCPQTQTQTQTQQPYYDPYWQMYFYPIGNTQPGPVQYTQQYQYQQYPQQNSQPYYYGNTGQYSNVQVSKQWKNDGSVNLTWTIRNTTTEDWARSNVDIKCVSGCHLLTKPNQTLWDIPYTVKRNDILTFTVNIWNPMYGENMVFSMVAGSKTLYTFTVNPN